MPNSSGLFGSTILEVALGLIFVYWMLSIICSSIQETIAGWFKLRAQDLERGVQNLLCDGNIIQGVLNHPLIAGMGNTRAETKLVKWAAREGEQGFAGKPSYIPARTFALALFDSLAPAKDGPITVERIHQQAKALAADTDRAKQRIGLSLLTLIEDSRDPAKLLQRVEDVKTIVNRLPESPETKDLKTRINTAQTVGDLRVLVQTTLPAGSGVQQRVLQVIDTLEQDLTGLRKSVESWYDNAMDRVGGVYKRRTQTWLLLIAFFVTLGVGADTLTIVNTLYTTPAVRDVIVREADKFAAPPPAPTSTTQTGAQGPGQGAQSATATTASEVSRSLGQFSELFGYRNIPDFATLAWWQWLLWKAIGLLVSAFAVSLGAPFWFDVLKRVSNVRAAGKPPEESAAKKEETAPATAQIPSSH